MATSDGDTDDKPWEDPARLERLYHEEGLSQREVADKMDTNQSAISRALKKHGLRNQDSRPWADPQTVLKLYRSGHSAEGVASELECSRNTATKWLKKHLTEAGEGYPCPSCDTHFPSRKGRDIHHESSHGESLVRVSLECGNCGEQFERMESKSGTYCSVNCRIEGTKSPLVERTCEYCDEGFEIEEYRLKDEPGKYCSQECTDHARVGKNMGEDHPRWTGGPPVCECEWCGESFEGHHGNPNRFCSVDCQYEWRSETIRGDAHPNWDDSIEPCSCEICGEEFRPRTSQDPNRFCSYKCKGKWMQTAYAGENNPLWAGGTFPYGPGWNERKKEAARRAANYQCEGCGFHDLSHREHYGKALHVHHKMKARAFDDPGERNALDNLAALCQPCHAKAERMTPLYPFAD